MPAWEMSMPDFQIEIDAPGDLSPATSVVTNLVRALNALRSVVPVTLFRTQQVVGEPARYTYRFELADGRLWRQNLFFPSGQPAKMSFRVGDDMVENAWSEDEFVPHRAIRMLTIELIRDHGCTRIEATWVTP